jgi:hypothetical protein
MIYKKFHRLGLTLLALITICCLSSYASADEIVDDITLHTEANGDVVAVVKFVYPVQYLRHFPQGKSPFTSIFFNILGTVPADAWQDYETHQTPPSDLVKEITVSTRDRGTGPKVLIKFFRPAEFSVSMGKSNQILLIRIKPGVQQQKNESEAAKGVIGTPTTPHAAIPLVVPAIAKTPVTAAPSVSVPVVSVASAKPAVAAAAPSAPVPAVAATTVKPGVATEAPAAAPVPTPAPAAPAPAAPIPAAPVAPSGEVSAPKVVLVPSSSKPIHIPLGGKDGLPPFPDIDQVVQSENKKLSENPSLAERIMKANNQAATLMEEGGNALLAGQSFAAIESFNKVLNLPPNKYTQDAQLWIAIARERSGQQDKAILEFSAFLKLYPNGRSATWVQARLDRLKQSQPTLFTTIAKPEFVPPKIKNTEFQYSEYGSLSMYYYQGASQTNTVATVGAAQTQTPTSFSNTDQKSLMTNLNMTARAFNNEYDNRLVFQDFYSANFLPGQASSQRLGAAYYEMKDRIVNYSVKIGRQSGFGGGVMGRFDGIAAGYGFGQEWRVNVVTGQLSDYSIDSKPTFIGGSLDFGTRSPLGGSVYFINQNVSGFTDRRAVGGNLRYFDQRFNVMSMLDYDTQFKALNMFTVQGTLMGGGTGPDYNFLLDRRRSPILDIRNAVNGTTVSIASMIAAGATTQDLIGFAKQRTGVSNLAQVGMTNHLNEKWNIGTDFTISNTSGLPRSGGDISVLCSDPLNQNTLPTEGCVDPTPASGNTWTISERMTGIGVLQARDVTNFNLSYTKGPITTSEAFQASNHVDLLEKWTLDTTLRISTQSGNGSKSNDLSPTVRASYKVRNNLTADGQLGLDWSKYTSSITDALNNTSSYSTSSFREFVSFGGRYDF